MTITSRTLPRSATSSTMSEATPLSTRRRRVIAVEIIGANWTAISIASRTVDALIAAKPRWPNAETRAWSPMQNPRPGSLVSVRARSTTAR